MKTLVLFPGLAADQRLFSALRLDQWPVIHIHYLTPHTGESLANYAKRIAGTLPDKQPLIFVGVSFGGILAQEVAKVRPAEKVILISSISSKKQLPAIYGLFRHVPVYDWIPERLFKMLVIWIGSRFTRKNKAEETLFNKMVSDADIRLIRWGLRQVLHWKQVHPAAAVVHIHGSHDRLFPIRLLPAGHVVEGGQHFMIIQQTDVINGLLHDLLA